ncbi:hypothetical protein KIPB_013283 [Kipferlia bialata]|uniref:Uncharacterized protein n=1 Tax=Kipferlia bialata TaxID=797122 RepID=A0A391NS73_9EUKA|nr:hypothetical protein KIPB_013283 [Kipferlia bialata]|eukprot:g13283.t1
MNRFTISSESAVLASGDVEVVVSVRSSLQSIRFIVPVGTKGSGEREGVVDALLAPLLDLSDQIACLHDLGRG